MSLSSHLAELRRKHQVLDEKIEETQRHPGVSDQEIADLKRQKLHLKDEIQRLVQQGQPA